jgi:hypothetical protein
MPGSVASGTPVYSAVTTSCFTVSRPPQAGSKFSRKRKYRNRTDTSHSFPYMAIVWRLVNRGSERWGRQLLELSWWLQELGSGTRKLDSVGSSRLGLVDRPLGNDCCLDSSWGYADTRGYVKQVELVWRGVFEIPCFVFNFGIPGACLA